ncbi:hypothetical protein HDU79_003230 [Rhizoclosmatium sp. JEL0117]|nr:hypothetical protein HDU79_003230 [Rhizoclosmatium sp. JEL0117]
MAQRPWDQQQQMAMTSFNDRASQSSEASIPEGRVSRTRLLPVTVSDGSASFLPPKSLPSHQPSLAQNSIDSASIPEPRHRRIAGAVVKAYYRFYRLMVCCHFLFILFNCAIVIALTYVIHDSDITPEMVLAYRSIVFTRYLTFVAAVFYIWTVLVAGFDRVSELNMELWRRVLGIKRRGVFWGNFVCVNMSQAILWVVVTVLFWDVNWICTSKGEGAELIPFGSHCNQLSSVWWYAIFNAAAIYVNLVIITYEELKHHVDAREEVIDYYTKSNIKPRAATTN